MIAVRRFDFSDKTFEDADCSFVNEVGKCGKGLANFVFGGGYSSLVALNCRSALFVCDFEFTYSF